LNLKKKFTIQSVRQVKRASYSCPSTRHEGLRSSGGTDSQIMTLHVFYMSLEDFGNYTFISNK